MEKYNFNFILIRRFTALTLICHLFFLSLVAEAAETKEAKGEEITKSRSNAITNAVKIASPAVVNISTTQIQEVSMSPLLNDLWSPFFNMPFKVPRRRELHGLGSGVIIDSRGYILTNSHVIAGSEKTRVILSNGKEYEAKIIGEDFRSDLAVLKIDAPDLTAIKIGNSSDLLIGEWVIAIGHPFASVLDDTMPSVTVGVVSAVNRTLKTEEKLYMNLIQTDASINPGNSGGPLVNSNGEMIGINTVIYSTSGGSQGIGFVIPASVAYRVFKTLITNGVIVPPFLGIETQNISPKLAQNLNMDESSGVIVTSVQKNSPAYDANIKRGDIIKEINGESVTNNETFSALSRINNVQDELILKVIRNNETKKIPLPIKELEWEYTIPGWGSTFKQTNMSDSSKYKNRGVLISKIENQSVFRELGFKEGDLIYRLNNYKITSLEVFKDVIKDLSTPQRVTLFFERNGELFITDQLIIK